MNKYDEYLAPLSTVEILKQWQLERNSNRLLPSDWYEAVKVHLSNRELSSEERKIFNKLDLAEIEHRKKAAEAKTGRQSGSAGLGTQKPIALSFLTRGKHYFAYLKERILAQYQAGVFKDLKFKEDQAQKSIAGDRDQLLLKHILETDGQLVNLSMNHGLAHMGVKGVLKYRDYEKPVALKDFNEGNERIVLAIAPCWGIIFPPYGLAKMVGTLRKENYACKVYDLNIQAFHCLLKQTGIDYWRSEKHFYWQDEWFYEKYLSKKITPFLSKGIQAIVADKPTIVGFSLYSTNLIATLYMIKELRRLLPDVVIVAGGPSSAIDTFSLEKSFKEYVNYFFKGEAEESFIELLKNGTLSQSKKPEGIYIGKLDSKIGLNEKAFADYSDYDLTAYTHKDGASIETSRGCVAQCSFCTETFFWKFRSMTPQRVVDEMKYQIKNYGFKRFWFVDSLANGDLKNFEQLVELIIENKLQIGWNSYTRCDGRMSKKFIERIAESGCTGLSYGVESGSQKVLHDMRKKIEIWEIYNNLKDTYSTNKIWTHVNWLIGFPTEENIDFYQSNILIYNVRKYVHNLSPGTGCGISELSDLHARPQVYGIPWKNGAWETLFLGAWYTVGFKNTLLNRFVRVKLFHIWLEILENHAGSIIENGQKHDDIQGSYWFYTDNENTGEVLTPADRINFNQVKGSNTNSFLDSNTANDFLAFLYGIYQVFKGYKIALVFDPQKDIISWGSLASNYRATVKFEVDDMGNYKGTIDHEFKHEGLTPETKKIYADENTAIGNMSFKSKYELEGNFESWKTEGSMQKETVHEIYRNASKKRAPTV